MDKMKKVPVLLICFNRLTTVKKSLAAIRAYKPTELYVAADGPRAERVGETERCAQVREYITQQVDWECTLHTLFREENVGCGYGPSSAISWLFETADRGVIIEDDCVPTLDFFFYCEELLERYKDDSQVMAINGMQYLTRQYTDASYYFSMQNSAFWGWATWRRAWKYFDFDLQGLTEKDVRRDMRYYGANKSEIRWWTGVFNNLRQGVYGTSSWDYQFIFMIWHLHGKTIMPKHNLVSNIGFDAEATHTTTDDLQANLPTYPIMPLVHPKVQKVCRQADLDYHRGYYERYMEFVPWHTQLKRYIKRLLKRASLWKK